MQKSTNPFLITLAVMTATVMQVLDTTIVNVALPQMQGSFSATSSQISWVLTSYLVASAIVMPLTGYFTDKLGKQNYLLWSIAGFTICSALCGLALNLEQIIVFRLLQGLFGAALVPLSQAIMIDTYPIKERGKAMAIWGTGVTVGPILGPSLGGYLTDALNWRWTFYINIPLGICAFLLASRVVISTEIKTRYLDKLGLLFLVLAIGGIQIVLDKGNEEDWWSSPLIITMTAVASIGLIGFIAYSYRHPKTALFNLSLFKDKNFSTANFIISIIGLSMYGSMIILPLILNSLFGYSTLTIGLLMAPRGIASMLSMIIIGKLINSISPKILVIIGIVFNIIGVYGCANYNMDMGLWSIVWPTLLQGAGLGFIFVPLSAIALSTLPKTQITEGAGIYSLMRTIGSSVGISVVITYFTRHTQHAWNQWGGYINEYNPILQEYLSTLQLSLKDALAIPVLATELSNQAQIVATIDVFNMIALTFVMILPLVFLLRVSSEKAKTDSIHYVTE